MKETTTAGLLKACNGWVIFVMVFVAMTIILPFALNQQTREWILTPPLHFIDWTNVG